MQSTRRIRYSHYRSYLRSPPQISWTYYQKIMPSQCHTSIEDLPEKIMFDILSRLPVKTIINCKCVCNKWRNLASDSHFVHLQIARSPHQCLLIYQVKNLSDPTSTGTLKLLEIDNELDHNRYFLRDFVMSRHQIADLFRKSSVWRTEGSANGLVCLWEDSYNYKRDNTYICNPITNEYMILPKHQFDKYADVRYGFGVSVNGKYKVIRLCSNTMLCPFKVEVYTLGTDEWRTLDQVLFGQPPSIQADQGLFYNNHVHWIVNHQLFSFNLDDETFEYSPLPHGKEIEYFPREWIENRFLGVLKGCLSLFSTFYNVASIWVMKEHGIKNSWHKELEIKEIPKPKCIPLRLIDGLNGKTILFCKDISGRADEHPLLAYCLETNRIEETTLFDYFFTVMSYRPSFLKIQNFHRGRVHGF